LEGTTEDIHGLIHVSSTFPSFGSLSSEKQGGQRTLSDIFRETSLSELEIDP